MTIWLYFNDEQTLKEKKEIIDQVKHFLSLCLCHSLIFFICLLKRKSIILYAEFFWFCVFLQLLKPYLKVYILAIHRWSCPYLYCNHSKMNCLIWFHLLLALFYFILLVSSITYRKGLNHIILPTFATGNIYLILIGYYFLPLESFLTWFTQVII